MVLSLDLSVYTIGACRYGTINFMRIPSLQVDELVSKVSELESGVNRHQFEASELKVTIIQSLLK